MSHEELVAAAVARIAELDAVLAGKEVEVNLPTEAIPNDKTAERILKQSGRMLERGRVHERRFSRMRELLTRFAA